MGYMTEERRLIQETARAFAMKEVLPLANKLDPEKADMPPELLQKLAYVRFPRAFVHVQLESDFLVRHSPAPAS